MSAFLVFNVGCIECGVSSAVVGVFDDKVAAEKLAQELQDSHGWREGGQNNFDVFELPSDLNVVANEYKASPP